ncbi:MAG: hypothetical protein H6709_10345 [Kofleriaceae bacterium]|nr:hypothetical protein [Kofleriaceae bacterium]
MIDLARPEGARRWPEPGPWPHAPRGVQPVVRLAVVEATAVLVIAAAPTTALRDALDRGALRDALDHVDEALAAVDAITAAAAGPDDDDDADDGAAVPPRLRRARLGDRGAVVPLADALGAAAPASLRDDVAALLRGLAGRADLPPRVFAVLDAFDRDRIGDVAALRAALRRARPRGRAATAARCSRPGSPRSRWWRWQARPAARPRPAPSTSWPATTSAPAPPRSRRSPRRPGSCPTTAARRSAAPGSTTTRRR